jgi:hypothetical protein
MGTECKKKTVSSKGKNQPKHPTQQRQHQTFDHQLSNQMPSIGAEGSAKCYLFSTYGRPRQLQACHIGADYQEQESSSAEQDLKWQTDVSEYVVLQ